MHLWKHAEKEKETCQNIFCKTCSIGLSVLMLIWSAWIWAPSHNYLKNKNKNLGIYFANTYFLKSHFWIKDTSDSVWLNTTLVPPPTPRIIRIFIKCAISTKEMEIWLGISHLVCRFSQLTNFLNRLSLFMNSVKCPLYLVSWPALILLLFLPNVTKWEGLHWVQQFFIFKLLSRSKELIRTICSVDTCFQLKMT